MSCESGHSTEADNCAEPLVLRPGERIWNSQGARVGVAAGWLLAGLLYSLRFHGSTQVIVLGAGVVVAIGAIGLMGLSRRRVKLTIVGGRVIFSGLLRDRVVLAGDHSGRIVDVEVVWPMSSGRRSRLRLFITQAGRTAVSLNREVWDSGQLEELREQLGLPVETVEQAQRPTEMRKNYPGTIPWWAAHPSVATVLVIVALTALVLVLQRLAS
jgi:hypothetical protein